MYNIHSHYENIFNFLNTIVTDPRLIYLYPYGTTKPENIEYQMAQLGFWPHQRGPLFLCYDQEPILGEFNFELFDYVKQHYMAPVVLVTTERNSETVELVQQRYGWPVVYYFHHIFAAHDWFRGYQFDSLLIEPKNRKLVKKYIAFNRLTSFKRVYRSLFIGELQKRNILDEGYVSYNDICPENHKDYEHNLLDAVTDNLISNDVAIDAINSIKQITLPLRIDYKNEQYIPNHSFVLSATEQTQESFCYVVTESCYWERKCHLTEKIFKPIVSKMPFILVGPAHNLAYLKSYGFKTFDRWWDESYDSIEDPVARMHAIGSLLQQISSYSLEELTAMLLEMHEVLEYNYNHFYSQEFLKAAWTELTTNLKIAADQFPAPEGLDRSIAQRLALVREGRIFPGE